VPQIASKAASLMAMRIMRSGPPVCSSQPFFVFTPSGRQKKRSATVALHVGQTQTNPQS
jgi:hypothetical protein